MHTTNSLVLVHRNRVCNFSIFVILYLLTTNGTILSTDIKKSENPHPDSISHILTLKSNVFCHRIWTVNVDGANQVFHHLDGAAVQLLYNVGILKGGLYRNYKSVFYRDVLNRYYFTTKWTFSSFIYCEKFEAIEESQQNSASLLQDELIPLKYVKLYHQNIDGDLFERASKLRRRDFFNHDEGFLAIAAIVNTLCNHLNLTLIVMNDANFHLTSAGIAVQDNNYTTALLAKSPTIRPRIFARTLLKFGKMAFAVSTRYVPVTSIDFNFFYCSTPAIKSLNIWDMRIIFHALKRTVWAVLWVTLLICAVILSRTYELRDILSAVFALFASLLSGNATFGLQHLKHSILFSIWMLAAMLLGNFFTGSMTSVLVKPLEEDVMTKLFHLVQRNYTLAFPAILPTVFQLVSVSVFGAHQPDMLSHKSNLETSNLPFQQTKEMAMLQGILGQNETDSRLGTVKFLEEIAYGTRKATLGPWPYCILIYNRVIAYMRAKELKQKKKNRVVRHCHIGKELVPSGGLFWGFFPPSNEKLAVAFQTFLETGIHAYWIAEFHGIGFANKVQERSRVKSPTSIAEEEQENLFSSLKLSEGHVVTIFILWCFMLLFSVAALILEIVTKSCLVKFSCENTLVYPFVPFYNDHIHR